MLTLAGAHLLLVTIADGSQYDDDDDDNDDDGDDEDDDDGDDRAHTGWCSSPAANQLL